MFKTIFIFSLLLTLGFIQVIKSRSNGIIRPLYFGQNLFELNLWLLILKINMKVYKVIVSHAKLYSGNLITKIIGIGQSSRSKIKFLLISIVNNSSRGENHKMKYNKK